MRRSISTASCARAWVRRACAIATVNGVTNFGNALNLSLSPTLRDYNVFVVGSNHVWSPVKDLDIGLETVYQGVVINKGRVIDTNKNLPIGAINNATGQIVPLGSTNSTVIFKSTKVDDQFVARVRVQRDFSSVTQRRLRKPRPRAGVFVWSEDANDQHRPIKARQETTQTGQHGRRLLNELNGTFGA